MYTLFSDSTVPQLSGCQDVYDYLWNQSKNLAEQTLKTPFLQHMQSGDLQADYYVNFMIQDLNYLVKVTDMVKTMSERADMPADIQLFMKSTYTAYTEYANDELKQFNLSVRNCHALFTVTATFCH